MTFVQPGSARLQVRPRRFGSTRQHRDEHLRFVDLAGPLVRDFDSRAGVGSTNAFSPAR